jgi:beta-N-acetylhexosaminidase
MIYNKIGQLFCAPLSWADFSGDKDLLSYLDQALERGLGGLILYGGDLQDTPRLLRKVQERAETPLFIMADVERGVSQQIAGGTEFPGAMALGATGSTELSRRVGRATGEEAMELGINVVLAPVLDVNSNPFNPIINVRSFGDDPRLVADLGAAYMRGCLDSGVMPVAKHFPGHGDTDCDSHVTLPVILRGPGSLKSLEFVPFQRAISEGAPAVMVGHIALPSLTGREDLPASLSCEVVTGLLRDELGFSGLVMTDAMVMEGAGDSSAEKDRVIKALRAGVDIFIYLEDTEAAMEAAASALEDGRISPAIVDNALARISRAKRNLFSHIAPNREGARATGSTDHLNLAREVAEASLTLVRNRNGFFPLADGDGGLFVTYEDGEIPVDTGMLYGHLRRDFPAWGILRVNGSRDVSEEEIGGIEGVSKVVIIAYSTVRARKGYAGISPGGRKTLSRVMASAGRIGVISMGSPYIMRFFPDIDAYVCLYSPSKASLDAALRFLRGELRPRGKLPVGIPGLYPRNWHISLEPHRG